MVAQAAGQGGVPRREQLPVRLLPRGPVRVKRPLAADGKGQSLVASVTELEALLEMTPQREIATYFQERQPPPVQSLYFGGGTPSVTRT